MDGEYKNLDKRLQKQQSRHRKEKLPGLIELIVEPLCKIPGYVCIPEREYRREDPMLPMPIVEPDPSMGRYGILPILPRNPEDRPEHGKYRLLPIMEPNKNKDVVTGYLYIPKWEWAPIPITLPARVPEEEIGKYKGIIPIKGSRCKPEGVYWFPEYEPDCSQPGEYVLTPGMGYVWMPSLKPKFDFLK